MTTISRFTLLRLHLLLALRELPRNGRLLGALAVAAVSSVWLTYSIVVDWQQPLSTAIRIAASVLFLYYTFILVLVAYRRTQQNMRDGSTRVREAEPEYREHRPYLVEECLRIAALVDRALVEAGHRFGRPGGLEPGTSRRRSLNAAHQPGVWEGLSAAERDRLNAPEGSWAEGMILDTVIRAEDVRVLRFALGVDRILTPFEFLTADATHVLDVVADPGKLNGSILLPPWELRPAETHAARMFVRCSGELIQRFGRDYQETSDTAALVYASERIQHRGQFDLLLRHASVAAADASEVRRVGMAAFRRARTIEEIIAFLSIVPAPVRVTTPGSGDPDTECAEDEVI